MAMPVGSQKVAARATPLAEPAAVPPTEPPPASVVTTPADVTARTRLLPPSVT
jgi:hypothetical protein